ncbi:nuclear pore complex protein NUP98A-like [Eucalyptus grandis]|uniref:nuclear pore complex protein NUP98A-like n=1 Tax=Eucalyptus grandis TaxID=71139 RepID=UPI00192EE70B|nr:nuclear pore complex protein NUP98A-like [Eucalyptus grandis]
MEMTMLMLKESGLLNSFWIEAIYTVVYILNECLGRKRLLKRIPILRASNATDPFGTLTGSSENGRTSTGVFGATQPSSPFSTVPVFGASSSPSFGTSTPASGASSTLALGSSSSIFGGSSLFGQNPAFGGFGSTTPTSPLRSTRQQTQPAFRSSVLVSSLTSGASAFEQSSGGPLGSNQSLGRQVTQPILLPQNILVTQTLLALKWGAPCLVELQLVFLVLLNPLRLFLLRLPLVLHLHHLWNFNTASGASSTPAFGSSSSAFGDHGTS